MEFNLITPLLSAMLMASPAMPAASARTRWNAAHDMYYRNGSPVTGLQRIGSDSYFIEGKHRYFNTRDGKMLVFRWATVAGKPYKATVVLENDGRLSLCFEKDRKTGEREEWKRHGKK